MFACDILYILTVSHKGSAFVLDQVQHLMTQLVKDFEDDVGDLSDAAAAWGRALDKAIVRSSSYTTNIGLLSHVLCIKREKEGLC